MAEAKAVGNVRVVIDELAQASPRAGVELLAAGGGLEQLGRSLVHPVDVFEQKHRRRGQKSFEQRGDGRVQSIATELRSELVDLRGRGDRDVERQREQRQPRLELARDTGEASAQRAAV